MGSSGLSLAMMHHALLLRILPRRSLRTFIVLAAAACGGEVADDRPAPPPPSSGDPVVAELAADGERLFRVKGCLACHKIQGGPSVGPDLGGVTERRDYVWYHGMVTNPDSMLAVDPVAQELLARYRTRMVYQPLTEYEVRALFEYLRRFPEPWDGVPAGGS